MLPHPTLVNREAETYVLLGPSNLNVRVTKENWGLRFNTKTWNSEYFPASYLRPVPTVSSKDGDASTATFPRSTINGTLEDFRILLLAPVLQKSKKVSPEVYRALSLNSPSGADSASDRATAPKRVFKAPGPGKNRPPRVIQDVHVPAPNSEQARVDLSKEEGEDDEESMNSKDSGSSPHYTSGGEEDKANTPVPSSTQKKATRSQLGTSIPSETTEAAGFSSDTSPRTESGDNDELSRAGPN
jgi:hypothetical protein